MIEPAAMQDVFVSGQCFDDVLPSDYPLTQTTPLPAVSASVSLVPTAQSDRESNSPAGTFFPVGVIEMVQRQLVEMKALAETECPAFAQAFQVISDVLSIGTEVK